MPRCLNSRCEANNAVGSVVCANCGCLLPGAVVAGRYRVESLLGLGGMGAVYQADDMFGMQQVALKVISTASHRLDEQTAQERFRREARYANQLHHKNIVPVLNFGQDGTLLYLVMALVTGGTLKGLLKGERSLPAAQARLYLSDIADAIDAVHAHPQQIVHRDIKPSNLLIHQDDGRLVLADFGIARAMQKESALTQRGWAVGTEHYIAPEQEAGKAEPSSDIYSMGVVAYQMFTGLLPFQAMLRNHVAEVPSASKINPALPVAIDSVIERAMAEEPRKRYPSARAFADAIDDALNTNPAFPIVPPTPSLSDMPTLPISSADLPLLLQAAQAPLNNASIMVRLIVPANPCSACGQENRSTSRFCLRCGHPLNDTAPVVSEGCQVGYISDPGRLHVAEVNEDMLLVVQGLCANLAPPPRPYGLFAVADGLRRSSNKTASGHEASRLAIETVADVLLPQLSTPLPPGSSHLSSRPGLTGKSPTRKTSTGAAQDALLLEQWLRECVRHANQVIYHCNTDYGIDMASTLAVALVHKYRLYVANVGDSRVYHFRPRQGLQLITKDHTLAANLVEAQIFTPDELYRSAKRNQHYRYLGQPTPVLVDFFQQEVEADDLILLCSDGLWHMLRDERLQDMLAQGQHEDPQRLARTLVDAANVAGGEGNVSAIVVKMQ